MRRAAVFVSLLGLSCGSPPQVHQVDRSTDVSASFDDVWTTIIEVFAEQNTPVTTLEKESGIIATDWMATNPDDRFLDCGGSGINRFRNHVGRYNVFVREAGSGTRLQVNTTWQTQVFNGLDGSFISNRQCTSTGSFERTLIAAVRSRLGLIDDGPIAGRTAIGSRRAPATEREQRTVQQYGVLPVEDEVPAEHVVRSSWSGPVETVIEKALSGLAAEGFQVAPIPSDAGCAMRLQGTRGETSVTVGVCEAQAVSVSEAAWVVTVSGRDAGAVAELAEAIEALKREAPGPSHAH